MTYEALIDCEQLAGHLHDPSWRLFDCRFDLADTGRGERDYRAAHLPGAYYAHLDRDLSDPITATSGRHPLPDVERLGAWLGRHGVTPETQVIVYDDSGGTMAVRLWWLLRWLGHTRVAVLDGGWPAWTTTGRPTDDREPPAVVETPFTADPDWHQVVSSAEIEAQLDAGEGPLVLMDARTAIRFRGEAEPIDPVAGHIPGAINLPLQQNLDADGRFLPPAALRRLYQAALAGHPADSAVAMCGSGVTACHNLLAMAVAGLPVGRLYAGSWSEWIRDPGRPVAVGD